MKPNTTLLKGLRVTMPAVSKPVYKAPSLSAITVDELPNNTFEKENQYHITQSATGTWPVYKKIQNTKITTEIKRVKGNAALFAEELSRVLFKNNVPKKHVRVNTLTGEVNIKGDRSSEIRTILNEMAK
ncbi:hypothetical protein METBIDRAFT_56144 [Metschnikowia bicuspidata var. bicuspidata NRRL YB-4993]|uniref:Large ribosomal subunit protein mL49 n=1 Tax=Metschnikowia bicuspidata var. bicuspidata NRRL YB-4993 TaxID=869754 RepID=A0A1A0HC19_9ASCO|nr:hypothetical protein METBIDRAFT_56144 [Metschnikowia bicuspidata var. bicuspidata NRRL YB-4993]OBA21422.1 hypothetical protein METBIDRAFT_56144 [Metschnikowia bicuspidata var. bicuspidata NRRL YB-4993]